ncbi:MAG: glycoside hydrolase family 31 protein [Lachnospiraceae bacterium]|nr:glycoside hydrolase family 31 protein [Lachnospiraceae bacterium]
MNFFEEKDGSLVFRENGETVMITPWGADSLRVRSAILGDISSYSAALLEVPPVKAEINIQETTASIRNGNITAELTVQPWGNALQTRFINQRGECLLSEIPNGGALTLKARHFMPLNGESFKIKASFISDRKEKIYGMGQYQQEIMDLKGCNLELAHRNSQASIPFYISSLGYGFLWNNASVGEVHFGLNTTEWIANSSKQLDYWITAGETPAQIEETYASVTGKAPMMPEYGLGFWQCKLRYYNQEQVLDIAREYKKRDIPLDVIVIDYYHWLRCGDWKFDKEYFSDPGAMVKELHDMGIETMVSIWPQVDWRSENFEEMRQKGLLVKANSGIDVQMLFHGNNVFMDATNPETREYVWNKCKENYASYGIKTFWLDEAEPEFTGYDFDNYRYYEGPVSQIGNIYPREYSRLFYEGQKASGQDGIVNLVRCAWAGSQRYGALVWSGDIMSSYEDFRKQICAGIHMGISGIPWWTTDIGGFHGGVTDDADFQELLIRWFEFGTFCPVMRIHGCRLPGEDIINKAGEKREWTGADNEVWSYGEKNYEIMVKYINIRELMRNYTRSLMEEAHLKGTPVIRALFYEFPEDAICWEITDSYMFGPDLLVAPVCHKHKMERKVYLPEGAVWINASDGKEYKGGTWHDIPAPIGTIPVFLRDGRQDYLIGKI